MEFNESLAGKIREIIAATGRSVEEKMMFGGLCFMVDDKMCVGVKTNRIMVRIDPDKFEEAAESEGCEPMIHSGKILKGFVFVENGALSTKKQLNYWMKLALDYNKIAKPSKKKNK